VLLFPLLVPPSLPLQEVHVSKEIIGKISVASKSKPMFFSTLQTLPLRPLFRENDSGHSAKEDRAGKENV